MSLLKKIIEIRRFKNFEEYIRNNDTANMSFNYLHWLASHEMVEKYYKHFQPYFDSFPKVREILDKKILRSLLKES